MATKKYGRVEVYRDRARKWRWRIRASNGQITATPGESFSRRGAAVRSAERLIAHGLIEVVVLDD